MQPHVLEVHQQDINKRFNPISQVYSLPTSIGTTLFGWAGVQLFGYCCFALPFEDIIGSPKSEPGPARGWHPDFIADEVVTAMGSALSPNKIEGGAAIRRPLAKFLPLQTLVWKSSPLSSVEMSRQQQRFELCFHPIVPWMLFWGGPKVAAKLWLKQNFAGSGAALLALAVSLASCSSICSDFDSSNNSSIVNVTSWHCLMLMLSIFGISQIGWPQVERALTLRAKMRGMAPDIMLPDSVGVDKIIKLVMKSLVILLCGLPLVVIFSTYLYARVILQVLYSGRRGQVHTERKKLAFACERGDN
jgi:hypothetical protein